MAGLVKPVDAERYRQPAADVVAEHDGLQQIGAGASRLLRHRQRRGHDAATQVAARRKMRIVRLVGVRRHPVCQRRVDGRGYKVCAGDGRLGNAAL